MGKLYSIPRDAARVRYSHRRPRLKRCHECASEYETVAGRSEFCDKECRRKFHVRERLLERARKAGVSLP
jgi:hypothetical protein